MGLDDDDPFSILELGKIGGDFTISWSTEMKTGKIRFCVCRSPPDSPVVMSYKRFV